MKMFIYSLYMLVLNEQKFATIQEVSSFILKVLYRLISGGLLVYGRHCVRLILLHVKLTETVMSHVR